MKGTPEEVFSQSETLISAGLDLPETVKLQRIIEQKLGKELKGISLSIDDLVDQVASEIKGDPK
jgi:energy-coupling factor transport system ATP-binding protein